MMLIIAMVLFMAFRYVYQATLCLFFWGGGARSETVRSGGMLLRTSLNAKILDIMSHVKRNMEEEIPKTTPKP